MPPEWKACWWVSDLHQPTTGEGQDLLPKQFSLCVLKTTVSPSGRLLREALKTPGSSSFRPTTYHQNRLEINTPDSR